MKVGIKISFIAICIVLMSNTMAYAGFDSSKSHWAKETILEFIDKNYIDPNEDFLPNESISLREMKAISERFFGDNASGLETLDLTYFGSENIASYLETEFSVTREEVAFILCKTLNIQPKVDVKDRFLDDGRMSPWAKGYVYALEDQGVILGFPDKRYRPNKKITKAEYVTILNRSKELIKHSLEINNLLEISEVFINSGDLYISGDSLYSSSLVMSGEIINISGDAVNTSFEETEDIVLNSGDITIYNEQPASNSGDVLETAQLVESGENIVVEDNNEKAPTAPVADATAEELISSGEVIDLEDSGDRKKDNIIDVDYHKIKIGKKFAIGIAFYEEGEIIVVDITDEEVATLNNTSMELVFTVPEGYEKSKFDVSYDVNDIVSFEDITHVLTAKNIGDVTVTVSIPNTSYSAKTTISVLETF